MKHTHNSGGISALMADRLNIAICAATALLCASCATGARNSSDQGDPKQVSQLYVELGTQALLRNEYSQAIEDLRKALTLDDANAIAHNHLGLAYFGLGQKQLAKAEIERSVKIDPKYSDAYINLGRLSEEASNFAQAKVYYNKALDNLEYKPRHRALTNLAQLALRENNTDEGRRLLYQSLQVNPDYCLSHFLLGSIFMRDNMPTQAAASFKRSVANTCTSNTEGHYQLGLAYMKIRDFQKARAEFVFLVEQYPQTLEAQRAGEQLRNIP